MLNSFVDSVKLSANLAVTRVAGRAVIGIALVIAAGFGIAAVMVWLVQVLGPIWAPAIMAVAFLLVAVIAAAVIAVQERRKEAMLRDARLRRSAAVSSLAVVNPLTLFNAAKTLGSGRRPAAVALLVIAGILLGRSFTGQGSAQTNSHARRQASNGAGTARHV